ncbi:MAG: hypothetical protein ACRYF3_06175, partial [Janthinobacterium lividum]
MRESGFPLDGESEEPVEKPLHAVRPALAAAAAPPASSERRVVPGLRVETETCVDAVKVMGTPRVGRLGDLLGDAAGREGWR